ncbi:S8 family serine peptidase [Thalassotalea psychrophila]|uniref:S8 family serine peptidase n=1 Tax=Thalassotalea psychrophila TaxID=3065647 RepID=A0ABY9TYG4_9GAMM|nr:S8 family serine peptidase [Colwelliaceae bacterium SQ149]
MKFNLSKIISACSLVLASTGVSAETKQLEHAYQLGRFVEDNAVKIPFRTLNNSEVSSSTLDIDKLVRKHLSNEYFIILQDQPLASYRGGVNNLAPTNVLASKGSNTTSQGKLDTKSLASKKYKNYLANKQNETQFHLNLRLQRDVEIGSTYQTALNGFTATLSPSEAILVSQLPNVIAVGKAGIAEIQTDSGPGYSGAKNVWQGTETAGGNKGEGMVIGIIDSGIGSFLEPVVDITDLSNLPPFHPSFADKVDEDGDGEIDYDHVNPMPNAESSSGYYGDCVDSPGWCNDKLIGVVPFGHLKKVLTFVRDEENTFMRVRDLQRSETGQDSNGHGTHVASTAAGNVVRNIKTEGVLGGFLPEVYQHDFVYEQISGVAPHANIIAYKACDSGGYCYQQYAIDAIEHAIEVGVDVINYSVGSTPASPWYDWVSLAYLNAREAGVSVAASAGNNGASGKGTMRTPGNAPWLMGVAAVTHDRAFDKKQVTLSGGAVDFELETNVLIGESATQGLPATDVVYAADVESAEAVDDFEMAGSCGIDSIPAEAVAGKVVICNRGGVSLDGPLSRAVKSHNLSLVGAAGMILINTNDSGTNLASDFHTIPSAHLDKKDGKLLLDWLDEGEGHQVAISASHLVSSQTFEEHEDFSGIITGFSSQGPDRFSGDYLVPDIAAPGQDILAGGLGHNMKEFTLNLKNTTDQDFRYISGTSMASPHVAGMMLLIKAERPEWNPAELQSALMLTAGTYAKFVGPVEQKKQTFTPAALHSSGAGIARVDLAIETGLVLNETSAGYLAADPFGDIAFLQMPTEPGEAEQGEDENIRNVRDLIKELPAGWHGKPGKMNIASMSKGACIGECQWTRTLTATKDADWTVSYSYTTEGMTLTSDLDGQTISLTAGEEFDITVTASVNEELDSSWSDGRVHLTPSNPSIPAVSMPVTVNFVAGSAPELVEINTNRNVGSVIVDDVVSIGTSDLTVMTSNLEAGIEYNVSLKRSNLPDYLREETDVSAYFMPINLPAGTDRVVVEILETSSPDIDVYMGKDFNANGYADRQEWNRIHLWAATPVALEKLDYALPSHGDYWLMLHNYGNQFNNEERDEFDPQQASKIDNIKFVVSVVKDEFEADEDDKDDALKAKAPKDNYPHSDIPVTISWNKEMREKTHYYGAMVLGSSEELIGNLGWVNIDLYRDQDDVKLRLLDKSAGLASYNIHFMANTSDIEQTYQMTMELVDGATFESMQISADPENNADGTKGQDFTYNQEDNTFTWEYKQGANAGAETVTVVFDYTNVEGYSDITPYVTSQLNEEEEPQLALAAPEMVKGAPIFTVAASDSLVEEGQLVTLTSTLVDGVIDGAPITYDWQQTSGPVVSVTNNETSISFNVVKTKEAITFRLIGNNSERDSKPIETSVYVEQEEQGSGGSTGMAWFALALMTLFIRRQQAQK